MNPYVAWSVCQERIKEAKLGPATSKVFKRQRKEWSGRQRQLDQQIERAELGPRVCGGLDSRKKHSGHEGDSR